MADRIITSESAENILRKISYSTGIEIATLGRIALSLSIRFYNFQELPLNDTKGREIRRQSLFGQDEAFYKSIMSVLYKKEFSDDEFLSNDSVVKRHIEHGCQLLSTMYQESNEDVTELLARLGSLVEDKGTSYTQSDVPKINIHVGTDELTKEKIFFEINNTVRHANSHLAIMGKPGVGKTQVLLKLLADIRRVSNYQTNFIFFDYKGDVATDKKFTNIAKAKTYKLPEQILPINPFVLPDYSESQIKISAKEKAESFASIHRQFGTVQKGNLTDSIKQAYDSREKSDLRYPDFREVATIVEAMYAQNNRRPDSLVEILKDFSEFGLFWDHGCPDKLINKVAEETFIVDLHQLPVLKELVAYLVIERLYKEMASLPDSMAKDGRRFIRTILVIDEAHNYLSQKNPFLQRIIREGRSKGVVVFFASQSPNDYMQDFFDFQELLEFSIIFACDGVTASSVERLLGCNRNTAKSLQQLIAKLKPFQVVTKPISDTEEYSVFRGEAFYKSY
jgi:DNA sulfur modification protein DndE